MASGVLIGGGGILGVLQYIQSRRDKRKTDDSAREQQNAAAAAQIEVARYQFEQSDRKRVQEELDQLWSRLRAMQQDLETATRERRVMEDEVFVLKRERKENLDLISAQAKQIRQLSEKNDHLQEEVQTLRAQIVKLRVDTGVGDEKPDGP